MVHSQLESSSRCTLALRISGVRTISVRTVSVLGLILASLEQLRPPKQAGAGGFHRVVVRTPDWLSRNQDYVPARLEFVLLQTHNFAQPPFDEIAAYSIPNAAVDRKAKAAIGKSIRQCTQDKQVARIRAPLTANLLESFIRAHPVTSLHAVVTLASTGALCPAPDFLLVN